MRIAPVAPYDTRLALRTVALTAVALSIVALVEWITDERGVGAPGTGGRSIGLLPLVPLAASIAAVVTLAPVRRAGELRALAALGVAPWRARLAPVATATLLAVIAAVAVAAHAIDAAPLFPAPAPSSDWRAESTAGGVVFSSERRHARIDANDALSRDPSAPSPAPSIAPAPAHANLAAALAIALTGAALSAWLASPLRRRPLRTVATAAVWGAGQVASFQAAGARAIPSFAVALPSCALFAFAALEHRSGRLLVAEDPWI